MPLEDQAQAGVAAPGESAGFTLLELIIVLVLAGLFMVVSIPALRDTLVDDPLKASARRLIGYINSVREMAVRDHEGYLLRIDLTENSIHFVPAREVGEENPDLLAGKNRFSPKGDVRLRSILLSNGEIRRSGVVELWLNRQGYMERTVLHLEDDGRDAISLALYPFLMQIDIHDGVYEPVQDEQ